MDTRLTVRRVVDWLLRLLRLLPGKASDPASLEARVRRAVGDAGAAHARAIAAARAAAEYERRVRKEVSAAAQEAIVDAGMAIEYAEQRIDELKRLL